MSRYIVSTVVFATHCPTLDCRIRPGRYIPRCAHRSRLRRALSRESPMSVHVTPHPVWVEELDRELEPHRLAVLATPVVEHSAAEHTGFFRENIRVERRHDAMWRAMADGFDVPRGRFQQQRPMLDAVRDFHDFLTASCHAASFAEAVAATNYAVEGVAQRISAKALRGLGKNEKIGPRGRWWLEEHAKYDDEHTIHALEIIKSRVTQGEDPEAVTAAAIHSLTLMRDAMTEAYRP